MIRHGRFTNDVNMGGVFGLGIVKACQDGFQQRFGPFARRGTGRLSLCVQLVGLSVALAPKN
jgi:hypothetical protein